MAMMLATAIIGRWAARCFLVAAGIDLSASRHAQEHVRICPFPREDIIAVSSAVEKVLSIGYRCDAHPYCPACHWTPITRVAFAAPVAPELCNANSIAAC